MFEKDKGWFLDTMFFILHEELTVAFLWTEYLLLKTFLAWFPITLMANNLLFFLFNTAAFFFNFKLKEGNSDRKLKFQSSPWKKSLQLNDKNHEYFFEFIVLLSKGRFGTDSYKTFT